MINTLDFRDIIRDIVGEELAKQPEYKIGTIASVNGKPTVRFAGEDQPSGKQYSFLNSYVPTVGDKVLLVGVKSTYVVLGKIDQTESNAVYVVEEGSNADGEYVRWSNGLQLCYNDLNVDNFTTTSYNNGALHRYVHPTSIDFPAPFIERPKVSINARGSVNLWANCRVATTSYTPVIYSIISYEDDVTGLDIIALGRWK